MENKIKLLLTCAFILLFILLIFFLSIDKIYYFSVVDGDTVKAQDKYFRALYIDTPEINKQKKWVLKIINNETCLKNYAKESKAFIQLNKDQFYVKYSIFIKDIYGRYLAEFNNYNQSSIEIELVNKGLALCYYREPVIFLPRTFECLEKEKTAKELKIGIWSCTT
jgi:endonuclease YncB( thermonuclease family)